MPKSILYPEDTESPQAAAYHQAFEGFYASLGDVSNPAEASAKMLDLVDNTPEDYQVDALFAYMADFFEAYEGTPDLEGARPAILAIGVRIQIPSRRPNSIPTDFLKPALSLKNRFVKQFSRPSLPVEGRAL